MATAPGPFSVGPFPRAVPSLPPVAVDTGGPFGGGGSMGSTFSPHPSAPPPMGAPVQAAAEAPQQAPFGPPRQSSGPQDQQGPTSTDLSQGQSSGGPAPTPTPAPANGLALNKERVVLILALAGLVVLAYMLWMRKGKGRRR